MAAHHWRTTIIEGWDKYEHFRGEFNFYNCRALDWNERSNIMANAQLRLMQVATASLDWSLPLSLPLSRVCTHTYTCTSVGVHSCYVITSRNIMKFISVTGKVLLWASSYHHMSGVWNSKLVQLSEWGIFHKSQASSLLVLNRFQNLSLSLLLHSTDICIPA